MKCIMYYKTGQIVRVTDEMAAALNGTLAELVPKKLWKKAGRRWQGDSPLIKKAAAASKAALSSEKDDA